MNPLLILRTEILCFVLLLYLTYISRTFRMGKDGRLFNLMMSFSLLHVIMDGYTVWIVNHQEGTPVWVNDLAHTVFYISAILFSTEVLYYVANLCWREASVRIRCAADVLTAVYSLLVITGILKIDLSQKFNGTYASTGSAPTAGFALCFVFFAAALCMILFTRKRVGKHIRMMLVPMLFLLIAVEITQIFVKEFLFTGATVTMITIGFFFSLENPAAVQEKLIMMDALSGLDSRSSYENDIQEYDAEFLGDKTIAFTFVFVDINNLRSINGLYGHAEGDSYIGRIATLLVTNLRRAEHIYRMGGDEFLAIYRKTDEKTVVRDIQRVHDACMREEEKNGYRPELAIGYAVSDIKYNNLRDVLRVADYMMYRNKAELKRESAIGPFHENGTRLNLYGLTDRVFDAMCLTSEEFYPYITNVETDVTRVAPGMAKFFGLGGEFIQGFMPMWLEKVHPADRDSVEQDIRSTIKGLKDYHFCRYRVKGKDGTYVDVTCRGGVYHGRDDEPDIFSGYVVNHGAPKTRDSVTGLMNTIMLRERLEETLAEGTPAIVMRLEIRNLNRSLMLYGTETLGDVQRSVAAICSHAVKNHGEVYSGSDRGFVFCFDDSDKAVADEVFAQIREICTGGVVAGIRIIPLDVYAGAVMLPGENIKTVDDLRSTMIYITEEAGFSGENSVMFYKPVSADIQEEDAALLRDVHHDCLTDRSRFFLRMQPIVYAQTGKLAGAEALLRYQSPKYGEVPPGRFISFLESDAGYTELGYDILRSAMRQAGEIRKTLPDFKISVNLTALQLYEDDFIQRLTDILKEESFSAENLVLELTERCKEMGFNLLRERVDKLREAGFRVALDDVGTGFSTIDLLLHLRVNEFKLDKEFTQHMHEYENDERFAKMLAIVAEENDMLLCFEGVETEDMKEHLKRFGDVILQGYYFDKPLKMEEFLAKYCGKV